MRKLVIFRGIYIKRRNSQNLTYHRDDIPFNLFCQEKENKMNELERETKKVEHNEI